MANEPCEPPSTAANKSKTKEGSKWKRLLGWFKHPKLANASSGQQDLTSVSPNLSQGGNGTSHQDYTATFQATGSSSSVPDLLGSAMDQERGGETSHASSLTAQAASTNPQTQASDWKVTAKEGLGVGSRFAQTLLKKLPDCVDANPVKVAFSIVRIIIEIKDAVGDNKDELAQRLEETQNRLLAVERIVFIGLPQAAEQAMDKLKQILGEVMQKLKDLTNKSLAARTFDYEEYKKMIQQIFQCVTQATTSFQVEMAISIQNTSSQMHDDIKKVALERLRPSQKADHKTFLEEQALKREECTAGTRVKILEDITNWANDSSLESPRVFWLTGQAGSGKTTIAYTIAKLFEKGGNVGQRTVLGGNFLCSRQFEETRERTRIIPTIAYQLSRKYKSYADALHVANNFDAVHHDVSVQLKGLLVGPWQQTEATRSPEQLYLIVIDALDEIKGDGGSAFLRELFTAIKEYDLRGFKFLATSRSDPEVVGLFESFTSKVDRWLQHVPIEEALLDVGAYLKTKLPMLVSSPGLAELVQRSGGLFIYAATAVKYLNPDPTITAEEQIEMLAELLANSFESASATDTTSLVDELYWQIMRDTFSRYKGKLLTRRLRLLYTFLCTAERTTISTVAALVGEGDESTRAVAEAVVKGLHAVLYIQDNRVFWYHASFPDFIFNPARSNFYLGDNNFVFSCDEPAHHNLLGESCFSVMKSGLRFNMGEITSSFLFDSDNADVLTEKVNTNISAVLRYSSHHWTHHLPSPQSINADKLQHCISDFLQIRVLFWIEAMNLLGLRSQCTPMLQSARRWVLKCGNGHSELACDIGEAANFATYFAGSPAAKSTPHLYISALATWTQDSGLCRKWKKKFARVPAYAHTTGRIDLPLMTISTESAIWAVAFSSDGMQIVSGSGDDLVQVWDASTGAELHVLKGHTDEVNSVMFSCDDTRIVSGSNDSSVRVWDTSTSAEPIVLEGHYALVNSVAFSSNGMQIVSGSYDSSVRVWDVSTRRELHVLVGDAETVYSVAFSGDGMLIASGSDDHSVRVWDVLTRSELHVLEGHNGSVNSVAFSCDSTQIVSGSDDCSVRVWETSTGTELVVLEGHTGGVTSVAFSSNGTWIVSGSYDQSVRVWDASKSAELNMLRGHTGTVFSVTFSTDGTRIASGSIDGSVRVWDVSTVGAPLNILKGHTNIVTSVVFSGDDTQTVSGSNHQSVSVWDASTGGGSRMLKGHTQEVTCVTLSSDGMRIVSGSNDQSVCMWDASTGAVLKVLKGHTGGVASVAFSSDDMRIVSGAKDRSVRVWDVSMGAELKELKGHTGWVTSVAFSSDDMRIVSGAEDCSVRVWDVSNGAELKVLVGHPDWVTSVTFSSDNMWIVFGAYKSVRMWNVLTGAEPNVLKGHSGWVNSVAISNDSTQIVSGSSDMSLRLWDALKDVELKVLEGHTDGVTSVAFSRNGMQIVSGSRDRSVRVWDVLTGAERNVLRGHTDTVTSVAFSSDSTRIISGSHDQSVRVWDVSKGCEHLVWNLTEANWIVSCKGQDCLMWLPQEAEVAEISNILIISRHGFGSVDFTQSMIGAEWVGCYTP